MRRTFATLAAIACWTGIALSQEGPSTDARIEMLRKRVSGGLSEQSGATVVEQSRPAEIVQETTSVQPPSPPPPAPTPAAPADATAAPMSKADPVPQATGTPPEQQQVAASATNDASKVWVIDPRAVLPASALASDGIEQAGISMQRGFLIAGFRSEEDEQKQKPLWTQREPITIPIMHRSRSLSLTSDQAEKAKKFATKLAAFRSKAAEFEKEARELLEEWNQIVRDGSPVEVLAADSPSLPVTQGGTVNMEDASQKEGFAPGQGISFRVEDVETEAADNEP